MLYLILNLGLWDIIGFVLQPQQKNMENLIEPLQITEEILNKIGYDFIRRYELKQEINATQLKDDTNQLLQQLRLYYCTIRQLKLIQTPRSILLDQKFNEVVFKVLNCLSRIICKLTSKCKKLDIIPKFQQTVCEMCGVNLNSKKIKSIQGQILDNFPMLGQQQLVQKEGQQRYHKFLDDGSMNEQVIQKKMLSLRKNMQDRQSGLLRSIQQFQNFRNDLIIGLPKLNSKDGFEKFNIKEHVFQMGTYFHNNLRQIENKLSMLKTLVKRTQQQSIQCSIGNTLENQRTTSQIDSSKLSAIKAQGQIKRLLSIKAKLQEGTKKYQIQLKSLKQQLNQLQEKNILLKQENYLQKMRKIPKQRPIKPLILNCEQKAKKSFDSSISTENITPSMSPADVQLCNQISSQIAEIRSQIESSGTKMEDVFPIIKNSVKKAMDQIMNQRMSSTMPTFERRNLHLDTQQESIISNLKKKIHGSSFKGVSNFYQKKEFPIKGQNLSKHQHVTNLSISTQLNYKIVNTHTHKSSIKRISVLDQKLLHGIDTKQTKSVLSLYKKSLLHTEGNLNPRKLVTKMSQLSSQFRQNFSIYQQSGTMKNEKSANIPSFYKENMPAGIYFEQNSSKEGFDPRKSKLSLGRKYRKNISCDDLENLIKKQDVLSLQKDNNLISIRKINAKKIPSELISSFLYPKVIEQKQSEAQNQRLVKNHHLAVQVHKNDKKQIKRQIIKFTNTQKKKNLKSIIVLTLDEISYLTIFFALMAKAHVSNPHLYAQLKQQIFTPCKNQSQFIQYQETMLRELVSQIILLHRKCEGSKQNKLCKHLSQFIQALQTCVNMQ